MNNNLIDQFIDYYWLTSGASKNTLSAYRSDLNIFNKWLNQKPFTSVDKKLVHDYFSYRKKSNLSAADFGVLCDRCSFFGKVTFHELCA